MKSYDRQESALLWTDTITNGVRVRTLRSSEVARDYVTASATQRRAKPKIVDLFASGTGLTRSRRLEHSFQIGVQRNVVANSVTYTQKRALDMAVTLASTSFTGLDPGTAGLDNRFLEAVKESKANLLVDLVEFRKTTDMICTAATDIVKTFHRLRSGRWIGDFVKVLAHPVTKSQKTISNRWLEYTYGWRPLMGSINAYGEVLANRIKDGCPREFRARELYGTGRSVAFDGGRSMATLSGRRKIIARWVVRDPSLKTTAELGITNPLLVAWELVPFSFVIDWFSDIGNYLNRIDALVGVSNIKIIDVNLQRSLLTVSVEGQGLIVPAHYSSEYTSYTRSAPRSKVYNTFAGFSLPVYGLKSKLLSGLSLFSSLQESTRRFK